MFIPPPFDPAYDFSYGYQPGQHAVKWRSQALHLAMRRQYVGPTAQLRPTSVLRLVAQDPDV